MNDCAHPVLDLFFDLKSVSSAREHLAELEADAKFLRELLEEHHPEGQNK